jgi:hypothetical protein
MDSNGFLSIPGGRLQASFRRHRSAAELSRHCGAPDNSDVAHADAKEGDAGARGAGRYQPGGTVPSAIPCAYSVKNLPQDGTQVTKTVTNGIDAPQGDKYQIRMKWTPLSGPVSGWLGFRVIDSLFSYELLFFSNNTVGIYVNDGGIWHPTVRVYRQIDPQHPAVFRFLMDHATFTLYDEAVPGAPVVFKWTDPDNVAPYGMQANHSTAAGTNARWDYAIGKPL